MVSLVDPGNGAGGGTSWNVKQHPSQQDNNSVEATPPKTAIIQSSVEATRAESSDLNALETTPFNGADRQRQKTGSEAVLGAVSGIGQVSAEQWAVIESQIERSKSYPRPARERGIQGVVRVRFKLKPSGDVAQVEIAKSSGYDVLDAASVKTVYRAAPMPYVSGWLEVPMTYVLK